MGIRVKDAHKWGLSYDDSESGMAFSFIGVYQPQNDQSDDGPVRPVSVVAEPVLSRTFCSTAPDPVSEKIRLLPLMVRLVEKTCPSQ